MGVGITILSFSNTVPSSEISRASEPQELWILRIWHDKGWAGDLKKGILLTPYIPGGRSNRKKKSSRRVSPRRSYPQIYRHGISLANTITEKK